MARQDGIPVTTEQVRYWLSATGNPVAPGRIGEAVRAMEILGHVFGSSETEVVIIPEDG